ARHTAKTLIEELEDNTNFQKSLSQANRAWNDVIAARRAVDQALQQPPGRITATEWVETISTFIRQAAKLREKPFLHLEISPTLTHFNLTIKRQAWLISELAGQERAIIAYYLGQRQPIPAAEQQQLLVLHGMVNRSFNDLEQLLTLEQSNINGLQRAVAKARQSFFNDFEETRQRIYAAADTADYPIDSLEWINRSTAAINTLLRIGEAITRLSGQHAAQLKERNSRQLIFHLLIALLTLALVILGWVKVKRSVNEMFQQKELAEVTLHSIGDAVITSDSHGIIEYINPIAEQLLHCQLKEVKGKPVKELFTLINGFSREESANPISKCLQSGEVVGLETNTILVRRDGTELFIEDSAAPIHDRGGNIVGAVMVFYDATDFRNKFNLLSYHATHDELTGLNNRRQFERRLSELMNSARNSGLHHALCYLDLDQFKIINDTCGHMAGDTLLHQLTHHLKEHVRSNDLLARLGGDEFGLLLENCPLDQAERIAEKIRREVKEFRFSWEGKPFAVGVSIGLVPITPDSINPVEILSEADAACFMAKDKGRNQVLVYQPDDIELYQRHGEMQWVTRIKKALEESRFVLYQQPIVPISAQGEFRQHHEILLRMIGENGELVPPGAFLPAAERYSMMPTIDRWVIDNVLSAYCHNHEPADVPRTRVLTINLSGASFNDREFLHFIQEKMQQYRIPRDVICFEVTETAAISNLSEAHAFMVEVKRLGCLFALDDFGSGLSSFGYLKNLPVDYLKIDGEFVKDMVDDVIDSAMVESINQIGHVMGLQTIAEFVENDAILERLRVIGVDFAQGYGVARPSPLCELFEYEEER
ncbi:MAG: EAL domain-containing protein, partial [Gammaproteobacteria bacterium]|nr:EAL domain-containing protein [Gammaproteobacteria bacterium]MCW8959750.1 EAL domain-containing protein [Gammaproteobacteria bacterium]